MSSVYMPYVLLSSYPVSSIFLSQVFMSSRHESSRPHLLCLHVLSSIVEALVNPLQDKIEDWKKTVVQLDKDHAKGNFRSLPSGTHSDHGQLDHLVAVMWRHMVGNLVLNSGLLSVDALLYKHFCPNFVSFCHVTVLICHENFLQPSLLFLLKL